MAKKPDNVMVSLFQRILIINKDVLEMGGDIRTTFRTIVNESSGMDIVSIGKDDRYTILMGGYSFIVEYIIFGDRVTIRVFSNDSDVHNIWCLESYDYLI